MLALSQSAPARWEEPARPKGGPLADLDLLTTRRSRPQVGEHHQHPAVILRHLLETEFRKDVAHVILHRFLAMWRVVQMLALERLRHQVEHLTLALDHVRTLTARR